VLHKFVTYDFIQNYHDINGENIAVAKQPNQISFTKTKIYNKRHIDKFSGETKTTTLC